MWTIRTTRCCSAIALVIACCASLIASAQTIQGGWSFFPLRARWTIALNNHLQAPPAFAAHQMFVPIGPADDPRIVAYDLSTGSRQWLIQGDSLLKPATGDGLVFFVDKAMLVAVHGADGSPAWRLPLTDALAVPLVWDNEWLIAATRSGAILAFRASDGHLVWRRDVDSPLHAPPALAADRVYLPSEDGRVRALRVDTGEPVWERRLGGAPNDLLALEDRLYVGSMDNFFYSLDAETGHVEWKWRTGGDVIGLPVIDERRVYFVALDNILRAHNRRSGDQQWMRALPLRPTTGPVKAGDTIVVSGFGKTLHAFFAKDGKPAGVVDADTTIVAPPQFIDTPLLSMPLLIVVTDDLIKGSSVAAFSRQIDPPIHPITLIPGILPTMPSGEPTSR